MCGVKLNAYSIISINATYNLQQQKSTIFGINFAAINFFFCDDFIINHFHEQ